MRLLLPALAVVLSSCSLFGGGAAEVEVRYAFEPPASAEGLSFSATVDAGGTTRTLERGDFEPVGDWQFGAAPLAVAASPARVTCAVGRGGAESTVSVEIALHDDWEYDVYCTVSLRDPAWGCFGCRGSAVIALDPALGLDPSLRLGVAWGGEHRDSGIVY